MEQKVGQINQKPPYFSVWRFFFSIDMKYYADYWNERVFAVTPEGENVGKRMNAAGEVVVFKTKRADDRPWLWEENGAGDYVEPMTAEEFESFGKSWVWSNQPDAAESVHHSWRNFIKSL